MSSLLLSWLISKEDGLQVREKVKGTQQRGKEKKKKKSALERKRVHQKEMVEKNTPKRDWGGHTVL